MRFQNNLSTNNDALNKLRGKFIVIYGINNLGKTLQSKMLVEKLRQAGIEAEYLKYPVYELCPSGTLINDYLRQGNFHKLTPREAQIMYTINRTQYEETLKQKLAQGAYVVAEDYTGTGLAWGIGAGVDEQFLKFINSHLLKEDLAILLDGERFASGIEKNHQHEQNEELTNNVRLVHLRLAQEKNWHIINANQTIEQVHDAIWKIVKKILQAKESGDLETAVQQTYPERIKIKSLNEKTTEVITINPIISDLKNISATPRLLRLEEKESQSFFQFVPELIIKARRLAPEAKLPTRAHASDAGLDLYANDNYTLYENERVAIGTGIALAIPTGYAGLIWDKSGLAANGLKTMGGVIDATYRGEIKVVAINLSGDIYHIASGQKIAQIIIQKIETPGLEESSMLDKTKRNDRGFGSTGLF